MEIIDKRQEQTKKLDLTAGSIIEDESCIWLIHINDDDSKAVSCIKSFSDTWITNEIAVNPIDDEELIEWFDADAHNLKNVKLVIE